MKNKLFLYLLFLFLVSIIVVGQLKTKSHNDSTAVKTEVLKNDVDSLIVYKGKFKPYKNGVHASYYGEKFNGRRTASGKIFNMNKLTAAHKKLPFGTIVKVTNLKNGKSVIVEITDRGPFVKGREIDLSKKAFYTISSTSGAGYINATLEVLQK